MTNILEEAKQRAAEEQQQVYNHALQKQSIKESRKIALAQNTEFQIKCKSALLDTGVDSALRLLMSRKGEHGNLDLGVIKKQDIEPENALNQQISQYQFFLDLTKRLDKDFYPVNGAKIISNEEKPWAAIRLLDQIFEPISHICYRLTWNTIQTISISNIGNKTVATFRETEYMWALLFDTSSSFTFFSASGNRSISFPEWEQNNNLLAENIESAQNNPWFNITTRRVTSEPYYIPSSGGMTQGSSGHHVSSEIISTYSNSPK